MMAWIYYREPYLKHYEEYEIRYHNCKVVIYFNDGLLTGFHLELRYSNRDIVVTHDVAISDRFMDADIMIYIEYIHEDSRKVIQYDIVRYKEQYDKLVNQYLDLLQKVISGD